MRSVVVFSFLTCCIYFCSNIAKGQQTPAEAVEELLDDILPAQYEEGADVEQVYENLIQFYQEPLNLNAASAGELQQFFFLNDRQINNLIRYREYYGAYLSKYELLHVPAMDRATIDRLLPFISIEAVEDRKLALRKRWNMAGNRYLILRQSRVIEAQKGYLIADTLLDKSLFNYYPGSQNHLYARLRVYRPGSISLGMTIEKDAGEKVEWVPDNKKYGADFVSAHFQLENVGPFDQIIMGDFTMQAGQQMVFGSGLGLGKGAMAVRSVGRSQQGIRPYTSAVESGFFRGVAIRYPIPFTKKRVNITTFYSSNYRHASLKYDSTRNESYFNTLDLSGLYRTETEKQKRNQLRENAFGMNLNYTNRLQNLQAGANLLNVNYNLPQYPADALYKSVDFRGSHTLVASTYFSYQAGYWNSFAEMAYAGDQQWGLVGGINAVLNTYLESVWLYRHYTPGFHSPFGSGFGEGSRNANEKGLYWGVQLEPLARLKLSAFYDFFRFGWLRYRVDAPSAGYEYLLRVNYELSRTSSFMVQYREESKGINTLPDSSSFRIVENGLRRNLIFIFEHRPFEGVRLKTRLHHSNYALSDSLSRGWVVAQDVSYSYKNLKADGRLALINTDDYNNRQYLYENDLLYAFTVPAYSGRGIRYYLMLRYKFGRSVSAWLRWSQTIYDDREVVGSGLDEINGNRRTQLRIQLIYKF